MLADLKAEGKIARVGAIVRPNSIGASTLGRDADQAPIGWKKWRMSSAAGRR